MDAPTTASQNEVMPARKKRSAALATPKASSETTIATTRSDVPLGTGTICVAETHLQIEGVHFELLAMTPAEVGYRSLAAVLSHAASRGDAPFSVGLQLGLPQHSSAAAIDGYLEGFSAAASEHGVRATYTEPVLNPTGVFLALSLFSKRRPRLAVVQPKVGDRLVVTRVPGLAAAGNHLLRKAGRSASVHFPMLTDAYLHPRVDVPLALELRRRGLVSAMRELRDGLVSELYALLPSACGAQIEQKQMPYPESMMRAAQLHQGNYELWSLYGSEDFALLMCVPASKLLKARTLAKLHQAEWHEIGTVGREAGVQFHRNDGEVQRLAARQWHLLARRR